MSKQKLCKRLEETTYLVNVYCKEGEMKLELISQGSAVAINSNGDLLTAAHVVTTRLPVRWEDVNDPNALILAMTKGGRLTSYHPILCGLTIKAVDCLTTPITIDLAVIRPFEKQNDVPFLPISLESPKLGDQVLMAGHPDDIELPFSFDKKLNPSNPQIHKLNYNLDFARRLLMIRSGMIGNLSEISINNEYSGHIFYIDNVLHSGASGGPVVNYNGEIIGILTERAITAVPYEDTPNLKVPSGAAVALTPSFVFQHLKEKQVVFKTI